MRTAHVSALVALFGRHAPGDPTPPFWVDKPTLRLDAIAVRALRRERREREELAREGMRWAS